MQSLISVGKRVVIVSRRFRIVVSIVSYSALAACTRPSAGDAATDGTTISPTTASETGSPDSTFSHFLDLSVATRDPTIRNPDSLFIRSTGAGSTIEYWDDSDEMRWLAAYRVLGIRITNDSAFATAVVTTVLQMHQGSSADRLVATMGVREDTAHWVLLRNTETGGRWKVRGSSVEGFSFNAGPKGEMQWQPKGASREKAFALVDSIRKARGHPILR